MTDVENVNELAPSTLSGMTLYYIYVGLEEMKSKVPSPFHTYIFIGSSAPVQRIE